MKLFVARLIRVFRQFYVPYFTILLSTAMITLFYTNEKSTLSNDLSLKMPLNAQTTAWWRFFTANLVHADELHLWSNVVFIMSVGVIFELLNGSVPTLIIFIVGGTTGVFTYSAFHGSEAIILVGASSGIYAVVASYGSSLLLNWKETEMKLVWSIALLLFVALEIYLSVINSEGNVAHLAHLGGFVQGLLVGFVCVKNKNVYFWEVLLSVSALLVSASVILSLNIQISYMENNL